MLLTAFYTSGLLLVAVSITTNWFKNKFEIITIGLLVMIISVTVGVSY
jgi:glycerol uptake facilitator-like aquaporin